MLKRKVYFNVLKQKLVSLDFPWLARRAWAYGRLRTEKYLGTGYAPAPLMACLMLTENCNLRCPMCDLPQRYKVNPVDKTTREWKKTIDNLYGMGAAGIGFTGGEPTLRPDIFELISHACSYGFPVTLNTNGLSFTDERIKDLIKADPTNVNISIDSGRDEINDKLRGGKNVLPRTLEIIKKITAARKAASARFTVTVVTVLTDLNIGDLDVLFEKVAASGADRIGFMPLHNIECVKCAVALFKVDTTGLADNVRALSQKHGLPAENSNEYLDAFHSVMSGQVSMPVACNAGYTSIVIGPDFTLYRCWPFLEKRQPFRKWNPDESSLSEIWNDAAFRTERQSVLVCKECFWNCHAELSYMVKM